MRSEQESGITITSVDRVAGIILGSKDGIDGPSRYGRRPSVDGSGLKSKGKDPSGL